MLSVFISIVCAAVVSVAYDNRGGVLISLPVAIVAFWLGRSTADVLRKNHPKG